MTHNSISIDIVEKRIYDNDDMKSLVELINRNILRSTSFNFLRPKKTAKELPIITISRESGSGGRIIASLVAKKLGKPWKVYHKEIIDEIAKETNLEGKLVKEVDEQKIPLVDEIVSDFFGKRYLNLSSYYKHLVKILSTIASRGHAIIIGRGADYLLPEALKIRVICEMDSRIKWLMEYRKLSKREAIEWVKTSDRKRDEFIRSLYGHDPRKAHHYDLVIRTGKDLPIKDAAEIIVRLAKKRFSL